VSSYLIESATDIRTEWLTGVRTLGLTASASAPEILVGEVVDYARERLGVGTVEEFEAVKESVTFGLPHELKVLLGGSEESRARAPRDAWSAVADDDGAA
jgi:4-hydroxy-3-methylbut-2-enyl diphosphate reductase